MNCNQGNGRINLLSNFNEKPLTVSLENSTYSEIPKNNNNNVNVNRILGGICESTLSIAYFSNANKKILQNGIRAGVYKKSNGNYLVGEQSDDVLETIMRSIFIEYAKHLPTDITGQIKKLNDYVLEYCVKDVYEAMRFHMHYKKDISTLPVPIALPVMQHSSNKQLELKKWF
jgi:hypothetical protein